MPDKLVIKVEGAKEIEAAMRALGVAAANRIARSALNRASTPIVRRARELAPTPGDPNDPYATGGLKKAISKRLRRQRPGSSEQIILIGIERPRSRIAHLLEFGAAHMASEPFLRPALDEAHGQTLQVMQQALSAGVDREIKKLEVKRSK